MGSATVVCCAAVLVALVLQPGIGFGETNRATLKAKAPVKAQIPAIYQKVAQFCDVPPKLLYAVALGESGRKVGGHWTAWPWTLNVDGKGFYFSSREKLFDALMKAITESRSVDVGPMQLNWHWKFEWLPSPWLATEPVFNIGTGCRIIRAHYDANPKAGWFEAAGRYHREANRAKDYAARDRYIERVIKAWGRIL